MQESATTQPAFPYLHGFSSEEQERLRRQARITEQLIYRDIDFSDRDHILEVGSGVGAQTEILLRRFPNLRITGIDLNQRQIDTARRVLDAQPWFADRYELEQMDATSLSFPSHHFGGAFLCWVLEHVPDPAAVLSELRRVLRPGSPVFITEVMNSSFFLDPYSPAVWQYWMAFNDYQYDMAGDPFIGAKLGNLLLTTGYRQVSTQVKTFHYDNRNPGKRKIIIAFWEELLLSAAQQLIDSGRVTSELVDNMRDELRRVQNNPNAVFFYSFIQASAKVWE
ncbi:MAG: hypothetical protein Tsb002_12710 [Wenzhouxiangellaceae bacterium]